VSLEFTGERVIPGQVDPDLWNEHFARYAFAATHVRGLRVLDAGCGTGYGSFALAAAARSVTAVDLSLEALRYASQQHRQSTVSWLCASCNHLPIADTSIDVVVSFEVIEHLRDWQELLRETRRVLTTEGRFIVSTPNKSAYAESRKDSGPNPFHEHEFEFEDFKLALGEYFPHVHIYVQDHSSVVSIRSTNHAPDGKVLLEPLGTAPDQSLFFIAVCGFQPLEDPHSFVYVPSTANVLNERAAHIHRLEGELHTKDKWLHESQSAHASLVELSRRQTQDLEQSNRWARDLDDQLHASEQRILALQKELEEQHASAQARISELEAEFLARTEWALSLDKALIEAQDVLAATVQQKEHLNEILKQAAASKWLKLGNALKLGPTLPEQGPGH
jgi:SAM-dependent methyltransferase